jgi:hypothetical protein
MPKMIEFEQALQGVLKLHNPLFVPVVYLIPPVLVETCEAYTLSCNDGKGKRMSPLCGESTARK